MRPSSEEKLKEYFEHEAAKIRFNMPGVSNATYNCIKFFEHVANTEDIVCTFDEYGNVIDTPAWEEQQKYIVDQWQTQKDLEREVAFRISDCGLEEYGSLWCIGEGEGFDYSSDEAFLSDVDWDYLLGVTKNCWLLVSINS